MQTVTNEQIYDRWGQVPDELKEAFFSVDNGEIIWKACEDAGLSEEIIDVVLIVMGNILLGFTHINDLAKELQSIPGMDQKAIDPIIFQIDKRIFDPVKGLILKLRADVSGESPAIMAEEGPAREQNVAQTSGEATAQTPAMIATDRINPAIVTEEQEASVEIRKVRIEGDMGRNVSVPTGAAEDGVGMPAPTIIHAEADLVPVTQKRRPLSSFGGVFGFKRNQEQKSAGPAVTAQISMIEGLGKKSEEVAKTPQQEVKVVHYTSAKVPQDMFGQQEQAQQKGIEPIFVPTTKQEHVVDFEPRVVDLGAQNEVISSVAIPVPAMPEEGKPMASMPKIPEATIMKTPQRVGVVAQQAPAAKEPQLAQIPVNDDIVDLRMLERVQDKK